METSAPDTTTEGVRRVVRLAAILNVAYFGVEFAVALAIGSVSLFADRIDFLEDTSANFLILLALNWSARKRARMGMILAGILLVPEWLPFGRLGASSRCPSRLRLCLYRSPGQVPLSIALVTT